MPALSVWAVRAALLYLVAGGLLGTAMLLAKAGCFPAGVLRSIPIHQEIVLLGWMLQLALGVGYWILPRVEGARPRAGLAVLGIVALNGGVLGAALGGILGLENLAAAGRLLELVGAAAFLAHLWTRIRLGGLLNRLSPEEVAVRRARGPR
ncbi:MAG: hypothetical protein R2909_03240 [Gemmatimonadales bacterium]